MTRQLTVRIKVDCDLWRRVKVQALLSDKPVSQLVAEALAKALEESENRKQELPRTLPPEPVM